MRLMAALALGSALVLAGCFGGGDDETTDTPTTTTPVTSTPPTGGTGTGTGGNSTGGTGGNATTGGSGTTTPPAPKEACSGNGNFAPPAPSGPTTCTIPAGYTKAGMNVTWSGTGAGVGNGVKVTLKDPDGGAVLTCTYTNPTPPATTGPNCGAEPVAITKAGDYSIVYEGTGTVSAAVSVMVS